LTGDGLGHHLQAEPRIRGLRGHCLGPAFPRAGVICRGFRPDTLAPLSISAACGREPAYSAPQSLGVVAPALPFARCFPAGLL